VFRYFLISSYLLLKIVFFSPSLRLLSCLPFLWHSSHSLVISTTSLLISSLIVYYRSDLFFFSCLFYFSKPVILIFFLNLFFYLHFAIFSCLSHLLAYYFASAAGTASYLFSLRFYCIFFQATSLVTSVTRL
jgi:hypothetical protein